MRTIKMIGAPGHLPSKNIWDSTAWGEKLLVWKMIKVCYIMHRWRKQTEFFSLSQALAPEIIQRS